MDELAVFQDSKLDNEIGGGKICPLRNELYVFLLTVIYYGLVYNDAKIQNPWNITK